MQVIRSSFAESAMRILLCGLVVFALTMAVYSRELTGRFVHGEHDIRVTQTSIGMPRWLIVNQHEVEGSPPRPNPHLLPEAEKYQRGLHIQPLLLLASAIGSLVLGAAVYGLGVVLKRIGTRSRGARVLLSYAIVIVAALAVGAIIPTDSQRGFRDGLEWVGAVLGMAFLPACLVLSAILLRSYRHGVCLGVSMLLALGWSYRVADLFYRKHLVRGLPGSNDLMAIIVLASMFVMVAIVSTFVANRIVSWNRGV